MVFKLLILLILISSGFCAFVTPTNISSQGSSSRVVIIAGKLFGVKNDSLKTSWDRKKVPKNLVTSWISQPVDHQNPDKFPNWSQRYFSNLTKYSESGPILIFLGGEAAADPRFLAYGEMAEHASEFEAVASFCLEHRFYGQSWPLKDASVQNLKYLTMPQALDDLAKFIGHVRTKYNLMKNPVILYGGSYSGTLVAYFLQFYPTLASAGLASSAPIKFRFDFKEYIELSAKAIGTTDPNCLAILGEGVRTLNDIITESRNKCSYSPADSGDTKPCPVDLGTFPVCKPLNAYNLGDVTQLNNGILQFFIYIAQYNNYLPSTFNLDALCDKVLELKGEKVKPFEILGTIMSSVSHVLYNSDCVEYSFDSFCAYMAYPGKDGGASDSGARQWTWQTCSDFASFPSTSGDRHPFGRNTLPVTHFVEMCRCAFGPLFTESYIRSRVDFHTTKFGNLATTRNHMVWTNGELDPVSGLGYTDIAQFQTVPNSDPVLFLIKGGSHCDDLYAYNSSRDSHSLKQVRAQVVTTLKKWLKL